MKTSIIRVKIYTIMAFIHKTCLILILDFIPETTSVGFLPETTSIVFTPKTTSVAIEPETKQCYKAVCDGVDCLPRVIANGDVRVCAQLGYGCSVTTEVSVRETTVFAVCEDDECISYPWRQREHLSMKVDCCDSDLCNDGAEKTTSIVVPSTISLKQCYRTVCEGVDCLPQAVANGDVEVCAQSGYGCSVTTEVSVRDTTMFAVCEDVKCMSYPWRKRERFSQRIDCCDSDLCNDGAHYTSRATSKSLPNRVMIYISLMLMPMSAMLKLKHV